jgi:hypothetical protein
MAPDSPREGNTSVTIAACGCPEQFVSLKDSSEIFTGLSHQEEYFPMISGVAPQSFFGFPPGPLRPAASNQRHSFLPKSDESPKARQSPQSNQIMKGNPIDLDDPLPDHNDDLESQGRVYNNLSQASPSTQSSFSGGNSSTTTSTSTSSSQSSTTSSQQARRSPINIKLRVRKPSPKRQRVHVQLTISQAQKDDPNEQLQRAKGEITRLEGELGTAQATSSSLMDEVSRLIVSVQEKVQCFRN